MIQRFHLALLATFSLLTVSSYASPLNNFGCDFLDMQAFYMEELGISGVTILHLTKRMDKPGLKGFAKKIGPKKYLIALAEGLEPSEIRVTMAHELVHVRQLEEGSIEKKEFEKHYLDRSFEDEAFRLSMPLAARFFTSHTCNDEEPDNPIHQENEQINR
ncbi:hypothetical protein [Endozoicomonas numazuensis]|uniref:IrrE N-terminal-like domain-containing protein n=1 Tax=Endozoicomonas numazuensis TaxID=1137799 RepID=A0A081N6K0_9GAMM|nr:hypothetical protein [Endozoicomonas numazuensis]KEQ14073.1 hypothetical protein GZ78_25940 [Endozoicomonas numazuensis]